MKAVEMAKVPLVYVAGPHSGNPFKRMRDILRAWWYTRVICRMGLYTYTPHLQTAFFDGVQPYDFFMRMGIKALDNCDIIFLLPGWRASNGTSKEVEEAKVLNMPIAYNLRELMELTKERLYEIPQ